MCFTVFNRLDFRLGVDTELQYSLYLGLHVELRPEFLSKKIVYRLANFAIFHVNCPLTFILMYTGTRSFHSIHNGDDRVILQAMCEDHTGKVGHRDQLIIC